MDTQSEASGESALDTRSARVLLVDDNEQNLELLQAYLDDLGCPVEMCRDGIEALAAIESRPPDLILLDIMMPRMDGLTLTNRRNNDDKLKSIPVLLPTAKGGTRDRITGINAGARHYVTKPFDRETFLGKVKKTLGIR